VAVTVITRAQYLAIAGSVIATVQIGLLPGFGMFAAFVVLNRFFQAGGWGGLVHVASRWFPAARHGTVMGTLSTSFDIGNICALLFASFIVGQGLGWRALFLINPAVFALVGVVVALVLRGEPPPELHADEGTAAAKTPESQQERKASFREAFPWLAKKPAFWGTVLLSVLLTFVRTAFMTWTPTYLAEVARAAGSPSPIAGGIAKSAFFSVAGIIASLTTGRISDMLGPGKRTPVIVASLTVHVGAVLALAHLHIVDSLAAGLLIGVCGLFLLGPYSLLAGAMTLDVAGKRAAATAAGIVDGAGYAGASLVGVVIGGVADRWGWSAAFDVIAAAAAIATLVAAAWWLLSRKPAESAEVVLS